MPGSLIPTEGWSGRDLVTMELVGGWVNWRPAGQARTSPDHGWVHQTLNTPRERKVKKKHCTLKIEIFIERRRGTTCYAFYSSWPLLSPANTGPLSEKKCQVKSRRESPFGVLFFKKSACTCYSNQPTWSICGKF